MATDPMELVRAWNLRASRQPAVDTTALVHGDAMAAWIEQAVDSLRDAIAVIDTAPKVASFWEGHGDDVRQRLVALVGKREALDA